MDGIDINISGLRPVATSASPVRVTTVDQAAPVKTAAQTETTNLISLLADASPPIDSKKVEAIRSLIAQGRYPIDEHAIAAKMVALDVTSFKAA